MQRFFIAMGLAASTLVAAAAQDAPKDWVDADTGHRVIRLTDQPGSLSMYFNLNAFTAVGDKMVYYTPDGISVLDMKTRAVSPLVAGKLRLLFVGSKTRLVYYEVKGEGTAKTIFAADIDSGKTREVAKLKSGSVQAINADETVIAGVDESQPAIKVTPDGQTKIGERAARGRMIGNRWESHIPMEMFAVDLRSGARRSLVKSTEWLNHLLFSPTDPNLLMFCHEGPWHRVNRIWTLRLDKPKAAPLMIHHRIMAGEIAGHEWFSADGKTIWYDLQTPRGEVFWVAGYDVATKKRTRYALQRNEWSVHFNASPDGTLFSGDGGDDAMVAHAPDGKWIYLFRPEPGLYGAKPGDEGYSPDHIAAGRFKAERLVNMKDHNYRLEPNARFTPDGKWLIFRSDMQGGASQVYMVELAKAAPGVTN